MKKLFALLMALVLTAAMMTSAMAYDAVRPTKEQLSIPHTLKLSSAEMTNLPYNITYSFTVGDPVIVQPEGVVNASEAVSGKPVISNVVYTPEDKFSTDNKTCQKELEIDWTGVNIKEPGLYRWELTKSVVKSDDDQDSANTPSNANEKTYLYAFVEVNNVGLQVSAVGLATDEELKDKNSSFTDNYPINTLELSISKTVTGNQGSREQYFKYTVDLGAPGKLNGTYDIKGITVDVPKTAYNAAVKNPTSVTFEDGKAQVSFWMKHGEVAKIAGLLYGTEYTIVESENVGYEVTSVTTGDTTVKEYGAATVSDTSLEVNTTVAFTNNKEATVPTGIVLESGAPIYGLLLAMGLAVVMFIGKRKEEAA